MKKRNIITGLISAMVLTLVSGGQVMAADGQWQTENGQQYWYENGIKQGTEGRGKEIYDPVSDAWYWLDAVQGGGIAVSKDVYQESWAGQFADLEDGTGKWVRYDVDGHMVKGWDTKDGNTYYFDMQTGAMAKGFAQIDGVWYWFDSVTGVVSDTDGYNGWYEQDGGKYWYENGIMQGTQGRGKEIYDGSSDAWYWLDAVQGGSIAVSKDVYQESWAGQFADREDGTGKWVRYDADGHMVKGWNVKDGNTYYFDTQTGAMAKGDVSIDGQNYTFDRTTGILRRSCNLAENSRYYKYEYAYKTNDLSQLSDSDMTFYNGLSACLNAAYQYVTPFEQEKAVHDYIILNAAYDYNNYQAGTVSGISHTAEGIFVNHAAVCDGYSSAFKLCMDILGIPCRIITGTGNGGGHAWNAVQLEGEWYMVDVTWDDPVPDTQGQVRYGYFNVTDAMLRRDHEYTSDIEANGTKYYYLAMRDDYFTSADDAYCAYISNKVNESASDEVTVTVYVERTDGEIDSDWIHQFMNRGGLLVNGYSSSSCSASCSGFTGIVTFTFRR